MNVYPEPRNLMISLAYHPQNDEMARRLQEVAEQKGLRLARYKTNTVNGWIGWHRYAIYMVPDLGRPFGTRSARVLCYTEAKHQKYGRPSIKGERAALEALWMKLIEIAPRPAGIARHRFSNVSLWNDDCTTWAAIPATGIAPDRLASYAETTAYTANLYEHHEPKITLEDGWAIITRKTTRLYTFTDPKETN